MSPLESVLGITNVSWSVLLKGVNLVHNPSYEVDEKTVFTYTVDDVRYWKSRITHFDTAAQQEELKRLTIYDLFRKRELNN